jgi:phosphate transport system permease protein
MVALAGGALALNLILIGGLLGLLAWEGIGYFRSKPLVELQLAPGTELVGVRTAGNTLLGEVWGREPILARAAEGAARVVGQRLKLRLGNREVYRNDFTWIDEAKIVAQRAPTDVLRIERAEYGPCFGRPTAIKDAEGKVLVDGGGTVVAALPGMIAEAQAIQSEVLRVTKGEVEQINRAKEELRLRRRGLELRGVTGDALDAAQREIAEADAALDRRYEQTARHLDDLRSKLTARRLHVATADGQEAVTPLGAVLSFHDPNSTDSGVAWREFFARVREFVFDQPRESNTEGGIFPAIFGTILMVFLMTFAVTPLGVLAALYLREYARQGWFVRLVRIAVNNLAGVPSIVFGVFGLGFFVYLIGGTIDSLFYPEALPKATFGTGGILWSSLTLALLTVPVVIVATEEGLAAVPRMMREGSMALGATKWETMRGVVLPAALPAVLTGVILAIARAAGEVAPLMLTGVIKLTDPAVDGHFPFLHLERKFMHLGFHIYDVGFQSPDVEATEPLVYATAFFLVALVFVMNLVAVLVRNHLRRKYATSAV